MTPTWILIGIISVYVIVGLLGILLSGPNPSKPPELPKKQMRIIQLQEWSVGLSILIFILLYFIQPQIKALWLTGTIGIYYAGISSIFHGVSATNFKGAKKPATGCIAVIMGMIMIGIALFISHVLLFGPPPRPIPTLDQIGFKCLLLEFL